MGKIRELVGNLSKEQLRNVDCFIGEDIGLFLPVGGACFYALTPRHSHPSYLFVLPFDDRTAIRIGGDEIAVKPEKLFALSPGIEHQEIPSENPPRYIAFFIKKDLFDERDYLKGFSADDPAFILLRLPHGKARFWTLADNLGEDGVKAIDF
ncbi:MAG: hypothetical protein HZB63_01465 [Deltaproteobacteria bacterium]|nr:hypothetical protein [Deltaproteobacteria bacterium]